jgi:pyridoxine/pyridoxamine 5'-phosphate oxidase
MAEAEAAGIPEPSSMALATVSAAGVPSVRYVLCRGIDARGVRFFTNYESRKALELDATGQAAAAFCWVTPSNATSAGPTEGRVRTQTPTSAGPTEGRVRTQTPTYAGPTEGRVRTQTPTSAGPTEGRVRTQTPTYARQVRLEGKVARATAEESDRYWNSRPRGHQLSAVASPQSRRIAGLDELHARYRELEARFAEAPVPRPEGWGGYWLLADVVELWSGRPDRMHERIRYDREKDGWRRTMLAP